MGVARYIKDDKGAIQEVVYQSGIKVKPVYGPDDLQKAGFSYEQDLGRRANIRSPGACIRRDTGPGPGPPGSTRDSGPRNRPTSGSSS